MIEMILLICLLLLLAALFSGSEIAFITANKLGVEIEKDKGTRRSRLIAGFYNQPRQFLSTLLVGNNVVIVIYAYVMLLLMEPLLIQFIPSDALRLFIVINVASLFSLLLGDYFPKIIFRTMANRALFLLAWPLYFFQLLLRLPVWLMMSFSNILMKYVFRAPVQQVDEAYTRLDLQDYVEGSLPRDQDELEAGMFKNALQLKNLKARECMVPRTEIVHVDIEDGIEEVKKVFVETRHSRILVSSGDIDNILGYVHHQSLLQDHPDLAKSIIPVEHIPEVTSVMDILTIFTRQKNNIAVIVDEFGGTAGIVTLEDITEEIFGEIEDEHDVEEFVEEQISDTEFLFSARLEIDYLNQTYPALQFPEGEYETLSGYIVMTSGRIPESGDDFLLDDYRFVIEKVTDKKIEEVRVFLVNNQD